MDELIATRLDAAELERFLESLRRAVQMQRKAFLNALQRARFPQDDVLPYPGAELEGATDLRTWLDVPAPEALTQHKAYQRLMHAQDQVLRHMQAMAPAGADPLSFAALLRQAQQLWQQADRLIVGVTSSMADVDELTGLPNRRAMERDLGAALDEARATGRGFTLAMVDVDHFKRVNDELGHPFGDVVLETLAARFDEAVRARDRVYRYGGEEFLVWMPDTALPEALQVLERLRAEASAQDIGDGSTQVRVTVSAGATAVDPGEALTAAVERADQALYRAKNAGRDRVESL
ncbi:GGDEF domain-containing protein [Paracidovorax sp. MALMAid1276]|uniref:GGDEF domain-containing protein n=1 Tax=Paracidovorax sp. MALMAid1276 TaxID=3411631 RepID=UPI003B9D1E8C